MRLPNWIKALLLKLGIDLCDFCTWHLGSDRYFWGDYRLCRTCDAKMNATYDVDFKNQNERQPI